MRHMALWTLKDGKYVPFGTMDPKELPTPFFEHGTFCPFISASEN